MALVPYILLIHILFIVTCWIFIYSVVSLKLFRYFYHVSQGWLSNLTVRDWLGGGSRSRFTEDILDLSQLTRNKIGISRFTKNNAYFLTRSCVTCNIWKVTPKVQPCRMFICPLIVLCSARKTRARSRRDMIVLSRSRNIVNYYRI